MGEVVAHAPVAGVAVFPPTEAEGVAGALGAIKGGKGVGAGGGVALEVMEEIEADGGGAVAESGGVGEAEFSDTVVALVGPALGVAGTGLALHLKPLERGGEVAVGERLIATDLGGEHATGETHGAVGQVIPGDGESVVELGRTGVGAEQVETGGVNVGIPDGVGDGKERPDHATGDGAPGPSLALEVPHVEVNAALAVVVAGVEGFEGEGGAVLVALLAGAGAEPGVEPGGEVPLADEVGGEAQAFLLESAGAGGVVVFVAQLGVAGKGEREGRKGLEGRRRESRADGRGREGDEDEKAGEVVHGGQDGEVAEGKARHTTRFKRRPARVARKCCINSRWSRWFLWCR